MSTPSPPLPPYDTPSDSGSGLWKDYHARVQCYDETLDEQGRLRACWARYVDEMAGAGDAGLFHMQETANRQLREHGATFHLHSSSDDSKIHPWRLDPVPLLIEQQDWQDIDRGLQQRARLLSLVLSDMYGPQDLIKRGLIPQDLVLRHPGFLRARWGSMHPGPFTLFQYAADLARGPGGHMWVVNDRTGIPPGSGYMVENRTIMARLLPEELRRLQVHRLSGSFRAMRSGLRAVAPGMSGHPRVVFYTPGPYSPAYFEHTFLASYLGYTLVQGDDLLVRDGKVWLKALEGLQQVDVIIRRVSDDFCDPLELNETSQLGVPGLMEAVRQGGVAVTNDIGSHVLENPGLMPFLAGLARELLGEELILPTAATWWCGQEAEKQHVLHHLEDLVITRIDRIPVAQADGLGPYTPEAYRALVAAIQAHPWLYIGQEKVGFSTMPVLENGRFEPRAMTLRAFVIYDGTGYHTMPGGLTRCGDAGQAYFPTNQLGGICKDTWILAPEPVAYNSLWLEPHQEDKGGPLSGFFTSSAAENLFWTGRYVERAAGLLQSLRVLLLTFNQSLESESDARDRCLRRLWQGFLRQTCTVISEETNTLDLALPSLQNMLRFTTDFQQPGGLPSTLNGFVNTAFAVRENWSKDTWRIINRIQEITGQLTAPHPSPLNEVQDTLDTLLELLQAFSGQCAEIMTRTAGWYFLEIGRRLEHGIIMVDFLAGTLESRSDELAEYYLLEAILAANDSLITYRRAYRTTPALGDVLDLLLRQTKNPRSVSFQLDELERRLVSLGQEIHLDTIQDLVAQVAGAGQTLQQAHPTTLALANPDGTFDTLAHFLQALRRDTLIQVGEILSHTCFKHAPQRARSLIFSHHQYPEGERA